MSAATELKHLRFQFVDTLNDEVWTEILALNPLTNLQSLIFDQCHSISIFTLDAVIFRENELTDLCVWSCRFIMEDDQETLLLRIRLENFDLRLNWYPFTGEEAPMPLEDIEDVIEEEEEEEEEEDESGVPDFLNFWNQIPPSLAGRFNNIPLD